MRCNIYKTLCLGISYLITYRRVCDKSPGDPASPEGSEFWVLNGFCCSLFKKKKKLLKYCWLKWESNIYLKHTIWKWKWAVSPETKTEEQKSYCFICESKNYGGKKMVLIIFSFMNSLIMDVLCVFPKTLVYTWKLTWMNAAHDCRVTHVFE